ncbi:unnamed protein product [Ostreobium quekettii]|uniref:Uncharacterized protein n=1 Tax=Ostreobium quekettii TaxID=121088 RepID=A0A8S1IR97_9CHLO|nr:unnamed protein product [Ostreobium quekettii]
MASFLGGLAREGAYFKREQEAELHNFMKKLVRQGVIKQGPGGDFLPPREQTMGSSEKSVTVLRTSTTATFCGCDNLLRPSPVQSGSQNREHTSKVRVPAEQALVNASGFC